MKKWFLGILLLAMTAGANAQFQAGTKYIGASASNLGLSYSTAEKFRFGLNASAGYFVMDKIMVKADVGYNHTNRVGGLTAGLGGRYYFIENGIFLGAGAEFVHYTKSQNDLQIPVEVGYCFYLNHYISVEPSLYYKMSVDDFSDKSTVGFKIGFGFYF